MKAFTFTTLLAAALLSAVVVVPFLPGAKNQPDTFALEIRLTAAAAGHVQIFYDSGNGFSEAASSRASVAASVAPVAYMLSLPPGRYVGLRLDPSENDRPLAIASLRLVTKKGRELRTIPLSAVKPLFQIQSLAERGGRLEISPSPGGSDPQLSIPFAPPLVVAASWRERTDGLFPRALGVFASLAALCFALDRAPRARAASVSFARALAARPGRAVALVAALAVIVSAYPVVFLGKSHVSPNLGTILLYDNYPTLPGYQSDVTVDVKLSDVGAIMWQHVPFSMVQHRALASGELPLWNRYNAGGVPLLAQGQSMFGDPLHFFVILANGAAWAWDIKYLVAKWLFATALGLIALRLTSSSTSPPSSSSFASSLLVALAAPFFGFFLYRLNHPAFFSLCYAPWPLYCWLRVTQSASRRATALWAAGLIVSNLALMHSGTVKEAYMLLVSLNFSGACVLLASAAPWRARLAKFAALAWAGVLFALLTAPVWSTFLTTLKNAYTGYNALSAYQIQPSLLLGAFDEIFYRPLMAEDRVFSPSANFLILLGLLYFLATLRLHFAHRAATALALSSLLPLALAFGFIPPSWIVQLPFLGNIAHLDNTFSCVLLVLWPVLAGVGFASAASRLGTREGRGDLIVSALLLFALVFGWVAFRQAAHRPIFGPTFTVNEPGHALAVSDFIWGYLAALLAASVALALAARRALARRQLTPAVALVLALCTTVLLWRHGLHAGAMGFETYTARPTLRADFHAKSEAVEFLRAVQKREPARAFGLHGNFFPGWTAAYGLETIHGPDALVNPFMRELVTAFVANPAIERWWDWRLYVDVANVPVARPLFDALNVRYYLDLQSDQGVLGRALKLLKVSDLDIYESPTAWPRAFFTDRLDVYDLPADLVEKIKTGDGRPFAAAQRDDVARQTALAILPRNLATRTVAPATGYRLTTNTTSFDVHASQHGVIVLTETFWPGDFRAELNGRKVPVVRLNHAFKGVVVDTAGDYRVTFRYVPKNFPRNLLLCALGAARLALSLWFALRSPRTA